MCRPAGKDLAGRLMRAFVNATRAIVRAVADNEPDVPSSGIEDCDPSPSTAMRWSRVFPF